VTGGRAAGWRAGARAWRVAGGQLAASRTAQVRGAGSASGRAAVGALAAAGLAAASPWPVPPAAPVAAGRGTLHSARPVISVWTATALWLLALP
jgi:hypothetical protein